ncbi:GntR family transcriptional regulator [Naasia aerilata]|uniref:GntR family transcriptional regulator n=1 Tax=Naasia aerilata TaxID=1162966 RepID=A0ABM8GB37_9MICO|nr:GntR family transcriptional regulator [Naasia aerilata]BDZ45442.1 GntR family transcriptional regulator [Naasia aerilata]
MDITLGPADGAPASDRLRRRILEQIRSGELPPTAKLPPVRALAERLGVAPGTVARVYRELEQEGVLETRGRNGTVVAGSEDPVARQAEEAAAAFADRARALGLGTDEALRLVRTAMGGN